MNNRMVIGIAFLVFVFLLIATFLFRLLGIFSIPVIIIVAIAGIAGWHSGGNNNNYRG